ncbi:MAG: hypothetical protein AAF587_29335 [Bacteroidota bacterium]
MKNQLVFSSFVFLFLFLFAFQSPEEQATFDEPIEQETAPEMKSRALDLAIEGNDDKDCHWDAVRTFEETNTGYDLWKKRWEVGLIPDSHTFPQSAYFSKTLLDKVMGDCGFRVYYALKKQEDANSMGLCFTSHDQELHKANTKHQLKEVYFVPFNTTSAKLTDIFTNQIEPISLETARTYSLNWQTYYGICADNIKLGKAGCSSGTLKKKKLKSIRGNLRKAIELWVPIHHAFAKEDVIPKLNKMEKEDGVKEHGIVFENILLPPLKQQTEASSAEEVEDDAEITHLTKQDIENSNTLQYDLFIQFVSVKKNEKGEVVNRLKDIKYYSEEDNNTNYYLDRSCPCPSALPCCPKED